MFCNKPKSVNRNVPGKKNRKRKKKPTHPQSDTKFRYTNQTPLNIAKAMSTWAQNYTVASTWQLKHQVAYWKSKAVALQYENKILHEMVREQCFKQKATEVASFSSDSGEQIDNIEEGAENSEVEAENSEVEAEISEEEAENGEDEAEGENTGYGEDRNVGDEENDDLEVSEEFIEFLRQNAKYKEDARKERERLKAKEEAENLETLLHEEMLDSSEVKLARLKELYGDNWERIMALETATLCGFMTESDRHQPEYWPNIPFNL